MRTWKALAWAVASLGGLGASWVATSQTDGWLEPRSSYAEGRPRPAELPTAQAHYQRLIVKFKTPTATRFATDGTRDRIRALNAPGGVQVLGQKAVSLDYLKSVSEQTHVLHIDQALNRTEITALAHQLAQDANVEYAEVDERVLPHFAPNDPEYGTSQWAWQSSTTHAGATNTNTAWNKLTTGGQPVNGSGVVVAVLDSGYVTHADLSANILPGYDFIALDTLPYAPFSTANDGDGRDADAADPGNWNTDSRNRCRTTDSSWHGSRVASVVGAVANNTTGMLGVAYGAKVLPVRVLGVCGGWSSDIAAGVRWAAGLSGTGAPNNPHPAKVLNLSLGSESTCSSTFQDAINDVRATGSLIVVSTGNEGTTDSITQPANCKGVLAVTAHAHNGGSPSFANVGPGTTISAPGVSILGTSNSGLTGPTASPAGDTYVAGSGTSFSAPMVSGVAALLLQIKPTMGVDELTSRLVDSARAFPSGTYCAGKTACGAGMLDADAASALVLADTAPTTTASASSTDPVARGSVVTLTGAATAGAAAGGTISSVRWTQVAGPTVTLTGANSLSASFTTPSTSDATGITFQFQATASNSLTSSSRVSITMVSAPTPVSNAGGGGGGGGGALNWMDLVALAGLALLFRWMQR
ncbi:MAG: S8 family peptidase, partial [Burkholderiaceae bacterium]|nr:S8 family peptidase [Burkholderiaceae bacterium]